MILCIDIGNTNTKVGSFSNDKLLSFESISSSEIESKFIEIVQKFKPTKAFIASVQKNNEIAIKSILDNLGIKYYGIDRNLLSLQLDVYEAQYLGEDRIANSYGALKHFPANDCLVIDIGTTLTFDLISKEGIYLGGAIYPGTAISAKSLSEGTSLLPKINIEKPESALGKTTKDHIQSGIYYGLLGAIERISAEICLCAHSPSSVKILVTGGATSEKINNKTTSFCDDLSDLVDFIDPLLTITGLYEIFKEHLSKKQEK